MQAEEFVVLADPQGIEARHCVPRSVAFREDYRDEPPTQRAGPRYLSPKMGMGQSPPDRFEAVYYSYAVPRSAEALTILGLVFDRIYFPGVCMPSEGFDETAVRAEIQRIASLGLRDPETQQLLGCMAHSLYQKYLTDFCVFSGSSGIPDEVHEVVDRLEELLFGPRPEGEIAVRTGPWIKGFPGDSPSTCLSAPDTITYPANALVFAPFRPTSS